MITEEAVQNHRKDRNWYYLLWWKKAAPSCKLFRFFLSHLINIIFNQVVQLYKQPSISSLLFSFCWKMLQSFVYLINKALVTFDKNSLFVSFFQKQQMLQEWRNGSTPEKELIYCKTDCNLSNPLKSTNYLLQNNVYKFLHNASFIFFLFFPHISNSR